MIKSGGVEELGKELYIKEDGCILYELCWALSNVSSGSSSQISHLLDLGIIARLAEISLSSIPFTVLQR